MIWIAAALALAGIASIVASFFGNWETAIPKQGAGAMLLIMAVGIAIGTTVE